MCGKQTLPLLILGKSRMRRRARTDLRGGRSAMVVPTATVMSAGSCRKIASLAVGALPYHDLDCLKCYRPYLLATKLARFLPAATRSHMRSG